MECNLKSEPKATSSLVWFKLRGFHQGTILVPLLFGSSVQSELDSPAVVPRPRTARMKKDEERIKLIRASSWLKPPCRLTPLFGPGPVGSGPKRGVGRRPAYLHYRLHFSCTFRLAIQSAAKLPTATGLSI